MKQHTLFRIPINELEIRRIHSCSCSKCVGWGWLHLIKRELEKIKLFKRLHILVTEQVIPDPGLGILPVFVIYRCFGVCVCRDLRWAKFTPNASLRILKIVRLEFTDSIVNVYASIHCNSLLNLPGIPVRLARSRAGHLTTSYDIFVPNLMKEVMNGKRVCFTVLEEVLSMPSNIRAILVLITRNLK